MARNNDRGRQRPDGEKPVDLPPDELEDMQTHPLQPPPAWRDGNGPQRRDNLVSGPAVDPVCPRCRQPVYPGYGTSTDDADFVHFDCLRYERGDRGQRRQAP